MSDINSKKIRVLIDVSCIPGAKSGIGHYTYRLVEALAANNSDIEFIGYYFNFLNKNKNVILPKFPNLSYKCIKFIPSKVIKLTRRLGFQPPLEIYFSKMEYDFIIFTNFVSMPTVQSKPYALTVHDTSYLDCPEFLESANLRFLKRFVEKSIKPKSCKFIITISEFTKSRIKHFYDVSGKEIIVTPIPYENPPIMENQILDFNKAVPEIKRKYLLFVGTVEPRKNILNLIKAYNLTKQEFRDQYQLVIVGGIGWNNQNIHDELASMSKDNRDNIVLTGYVSDALREALYKNAVATVNLSHYEGFGMPIKESLFYKKPVLLSDIPVFREVAGDDPNIIFCQGDDMKSIIKGLEKIVSVNFEHDPIGQKQISWKDNSKMIIEHIKASLN